MGCWSETCSLTHLPISYGDRAVYLPITEVAHYGGYKPTICYYYPSDVFQVSGFPIRGTYNDYGVLGKVDMTPSTKLTVKCYQQLLKDKKIIIEEGRHNDEPNEMTDIYSLQELIEREKLFYSDKKRAVGFMAMHEEFYDAIIDRILKRKMYPKYNTFKSEIEACLKKAKKNSDELEETYKIKGTDPAEEIVRKMTMRSIERDSRYNEISSFFSGGTGERNRFLEGSMYLEHIFKNMDNEALIKDVIGLFAFDTALNIMRIMYAPQCGKGSQSREYDLHTVLAKGILKKTEEVVKEVNDDHILEEDEDPTAETLFNFYSMRKEDE